VGNEQDDAVAPAEWKTSTAEMMAMYGSCGGNLTDDTHARLIAADRIYRSLFVEKV